MKSRDEIIEFQYKQSDKIKLLVPNISSDQFQIDGSVDIHFSDIEFLNLLSEKLLFFGIVKFSFDFNTDGDVYVVVNVTLGEYGYVILDRRLSNILGFENTTFENGTHRAKRVLDRTLLKNTKQSTVINYVKYTTKLIDFREPSDASLDSIAEALHLSFKAESEDVMVAVDDNEEYMEFDIKKDYLEFQLPESIADYFAVSSDYRFSKRTSLLLPKSTKPTRENILCCTDLIDHQLYGNQEFPIIRDVFIGESVIKGPFRRNFDSVQYYPLMKKVFRSVTVNFITSSSKFTIGSEPVSVLFHIRKK
ncbi:unnamed protein product [Orchesella dallaii]|uniref:Uncharacterized protein n=1 Tax=Orchesella dallaii TaxID=48710 RepID=A0ABP1RGT8_9HEXA